MLKGLFLRVCFGLRLISDLQCNESLKNDRSKWDALISAARLCLNEEQQRVLIKIEERSLSARNERNKFAHNIWGHTDELPDRILLIPTNSYSDFVDNETASYAFSQAGLIDPSKVMVYNLNDLENALQRCRLAAGWYWRLHHHLFCERMNDTRRQVYETHDAIRGINSSLEDAQAKNWNELKKELQI